MRPLLERLAAGEVVVGDGAWGTQLMTRGLRPGACPEALNLERPELLEEIALLYLAAGAEVLTTNTFGGSPLRLAQYGLAERCEQVNRQAVEALRRVAGERAYLAGSVGPCGHILKPYGDADPEQVQAGFERQIRALAAAGADLVCVETMTDLEEARLAIAAARAVAPGLPVMATMTFDPTPRGFFTIMGTSVAQAAAGLERAGADIVGSNCGNGVELMVAIARELKVHSRLPVAIQANAGLPEHHAGTVVYPETPTQFAAAARELIALEVGFIGGCCGTGPEHIRATRRVVDELRSGVSAPPA